MPFDVRENDLMDFFRKYNPTGCNIIMDRETGRSKGFGFVCFSDSTTANEAMLAMQNANFRGRTVSFCAKDGTLIAHSHFCRFELVLLPADHLEVKTIKMVIALVVLVVVVGLGLIVRNVVLMAPVVI